MKPNTVLVLCGVLLLVFFSSCQPSIENEELAPPDDIPAITIDQPEQISTAQDESSTEIITEIGNGSIPPGALDPQSLKYMGAFRLPDDSGGMGWDYSGQGMTFYPQGDPQGAADGFPGSLYVVGHDLQPFVAEINIPQPIVSKNLEDLNVARTLQPFADITGGAISEELEIPCVGIEYVPAQARQGAPKIHFNLGEHFQEFAPSHGWAELDLENPNPAGLWIFDGYSNYITNDYLFAIPEEWASSYANHYTLASGRFREGVWGGFGPTLFAYAPWQDGNPPTPGSTLTAIQPLLLYGIQVEGAPDIQTSNTMRMDGYGESDHWWGGAWLTSPAGNAVIFVGTKAKGESWYGFANGVRWAYDCAENPAADCPEVPDFPYENRGYWAEDYIPAILFFNPDDLAKVAQGEFATYDPQPYALMNLSDYWFDPQIRLEIYKRDLVGAAAFDRENGYLFIIERLADEYKSVIHIFQVDAN